MSHNKGPLERNSIVRDKVVTLIILKKIIKLKRPRQLGRN